MGKRIRMYNMMDVSDGTFQVERPHIGVLNAASSEVLTRTNH